MGKKIKLISDNKLAKNHNACSSLVLVQTLVHNTFGGIHYTIPSFYMYNFSIARKAFNKLETYQEDILKLPVMDNNSRMISDHKLLNKIYKEGFDLVVHIYLGFDYFFVDIMAMVYGNNKEMKKNFKRWEPIKKMNHILKKILNKKNMINSVGYSKFAEIERNRHAFNHPTIYNIHNGELNLWEEVPLAWVISGKYKEAYLETISFFNELNKIWNNEKIKYKQSETLTVKRGIKLMHSIKK